MARRGFGSTLIERSLEALGGGTEVRYGADGLSCRIGMPLAELEAAPGRAEWGMGTVEHRPGQATGPVQNLQGKRILVAMDIEAQLTAAGAVVV